MGGNPFRVLISLPALELGAARPSCYSVVLILINHSQKQDVKQIPSSSPKKDALVVDIGSDLGIAAHNIVFEFGPHVLLARQLRLARYTGDALQNARRHT